MALARPRASNDADPPEGDGWLSEVKLDGYRLLVWLDDGKARLVTRNGHDWTPRLPRLAGRFARLRARTALLDGEMAALRPDGVFSFHDLQAALSEGRDSDLFFYVFDLLHLNGWDLRNCALADRTPSVADELEFERSRSDGGWTSVAPPRNRRRT